MYITYITYIGQFLPHHVVTLLSGCFQDAMMALNSELQLSQGTIGDLKSSVKEVRILRTGTESGTDATSLREGGRERGEGRDVGRGGQGRESDSGDRSAGERRGKVSVRMSSDWEREIWRVSQLCT